MHPYGHHVNRQIAHDRQHRWHRDVTRPRHPMPWSKASRRRERSTG